MIPLYELRPLLLTDVPALHDACWPDHPLDSISEMLARVLVMMQDERALGLVALSNTQVIAYGQLTLWPHTAEISDLIVMPAYRDQGIGTAIIRHLISVAQSGSSPQVEIGAALNNPRAIALYRRLGFHDDRTIEIDLGHGLEQVLYLSQTLIPFAL